MVSLKYDGITNPCADVFLDDENSMTAFKYCDSIRSICLPKGYLDKVFCDRNEFCLTDSCENLILESDSCSQDICWKGEKISRKRKNTTEWESHSNGCADYQCDKTIGPIQWSMCNNTNQHKFMCINDGCLLRDQMWSVEISFEGIKEYELNRTEVKAQIEALTGLEITDVGIELGDDAYVLNVIVIVDDEDTGKIIVDAVIEMDRSENCKYGTLCQSTSASLVVNAMSFSNTVSIHSNIFNNGFVLLLFWVVVFSIRSM